MRNNLLNQTLLNIISSEERPNDRSPQLNYHKSMVRGIELESRYGRREEMEKMMRFAELAYEFGMSGKVESLFYDSNACVCEFELCCVLDDEEKQALLQIAEKAIGQLDRCELAFQEI